MMAQAIQAVIGDAMESRLQEIKVNLQDEHFIFSAWPFYTSKGKLAKLASIGIHEFVGHDGPIMLDSGGFQMIRKNAPITRDDTLDIYTKAKMRDGDLAITLDYCPRADDPPATRIQKIRATNDNFKYMVERNPRVLHVVHGWTRKELRSSMSVVSDLYSVGSYLGMLAKPANLTMVAMNMGLDEMLKTRATSIKDLVMQHLLDFVDILRVDHMDDLRVHVLGAGSSHSNHVLWYAGMDQMDSAAWRIKAAFGKISLMGVNEITISNAGATFGKTAWKENYDGLLFDCECAVCNGLSLAERKAILSTSFKARAVHNAAIYLEERDKARELLGTRKYRPYLDERLKKSSFWSRFLKKVDEGRHQKRLDLYLKESA